MKLPGRVLRRREKLQKVKFGDLFFQENHWQFNHSFLARSPLERSKKLEKTYQKTTYVKSFLFNQRERADRVFHAPAKNREKLESQTARLAVLRKDSRSLFEALLKDFHQIFSEAYLERTGYGKGEQAFNQHLEDFHDCVHYIIEIDDFYNSAK